MANARKFQRGEHGMLRHVYEHFARSLRVFKQCGSQKAPTKREDYWTHTLKSKAPLGIDVEDGP